MSLLVVVAVTFIAFLYVRMTRKARREWLQKLDLPGRWLADSGNENTDSITEMTLTGQLDGGEYVLQRGGAMQRGQWRLAGHTLTMRDDGSSQSFDLHLFKAGNIGLEDSSGTRHVLLKAADNVVALRDRSRST